MTAEFTRYLALLTFAAGLGGCAAGELGSQYEEISEAESRLVFAGPGLANGYRQFLYGQNEHYLEISSGMYGPPKGAFPQAYVRLVETPPDRHFTRLPTVSSMIEDYNLFEGKKITRGPGGRAVNAIGSFEYLEFTADALACVVWQQPFGQMDMTGVGNGYFSGYYCRVGQTMMSPGEASGIPKRMDRRRPNN